MGPESLINVELHTLEKSFDIVYSKRFDFHEFETGRLHEKRIVANWNLETISGFPEGK
jgi:hypothetical protein